MSYAKHTVLIRTFFVLFLSWFLINPCDAAGISKLPADGTEIEACIKVNGKYLGVANDGRLTLLNDAPAVNNFIIGKISTENGLDKITIKSKEFGGYLAGDNIRLMVTKKWVVDSQLDSLFKCSSKRPFNLYAEPSSAGFKISVTDKKLGEYLRLDSDGLRMYQPDTDSTAVEQVGGAIRKYYTKSISQSEASGFEFITLGSATATPSATSGAAATSSSAVPAAAKFTNTSATSSTESSAKKTTSLITAAPVTKPDKNEIKIDESISLIPSVTPGAMGIVGEEPAIKSAPAGPVVVPSPVVSVGATDSI